MGSFLDTLSDLLLAAIDDRREIIDVIYRLRVVAFPAREFSDTGTTRTRLSLLHISGALNKNCFPKI